MVSRNRWAWGGTLFIGMSAVVALHGCGDPNTSQNAESIATAQQHAMAAVGVTKPVQTPFVQFDTSATDTAATGSGVRVHANHGFIPCKTCHLVAGVVQFDPAGKAVIPGTLRTDVNGNVIVNADGTVSTSNILKPAQVPSYNPSNGTCSNVACHWVKPGTFDYYSLDGLATAYFGTPLPLTTSDWYAGLSDSATQCAACHGYPPYAFPNQYVWHSTWHGNTNLTSTQNPDVLGFNRCDTCHPDVTCTINGTPGTSGATMTTVITDPAKHMNGTVEVKEAGMGDFPCYFCHGG